MKQSFLNEEGFILLCLCLAVFRIYLEVIKFNLAQLPISKSMGQRGHKVHKYGLYMSVGYVLLFAPQMLLG